jgi:hypothetical protein
MKTLNLLMAIAIIVIINFVACKPKHINCCADFNSSSSFPAGTSYSHANDSVYYSCGFTVFTDSFYLNGKGYYTSANIKPARPGFGAGQVINLDNVSLKFTNISTVKLVTITFDYLAYDTSQNLSVNGSLYIGELKAAPVSLGGATVSITAVPSTATPYGKKGTVTLTGVVKEFKIGGREFFLDNVCFK